MRKFQKLDAAKRDDESGALILFCTDAAEDCQIALRREGAHVALSASFGPVEMALRPRYEELKRTLSRLQPIGGLQTPRQVGTTDTYLAVGRRATNELVLRPTLINDAFGYMSMNFLLTAELKNVLFEWLNIENGEQGS